MYFPRVKVKMNDPFTNEHKEYSFKGVLPNYDNIEQAMSEYVNMLEPEEAEYAIKMMRFYFLFKEVEPNSCVKSINIKELIIHGVVKEKEFDGDDLECLLEYDQLAELTRKAVLTQQNFNLQMTEQGYIEFKNMLLDEAEGIDHDLDDIFDNAKKNRLSKLNLYQKLKLRIKRIDFGRIREEAKNDVLRTIIQTVYKQEEYLSRNGFRDLAYELLKNFNQTKYNELLNQYIKYLSDDYEGKGIKYFQEQISWLQKGFNLNEHDEVENYLYWIYDHGASRFEAFKAVLFEADDVYQGFCDWFHKKEYKRLRKKMSKEDRRVFQLLFFRRELFAFRIPIYEPLFMSFWQYSEEILGLIISVLIFKENDVFDYMLDQELKRKWIKYLEKFPMIVEKSRIYEFLKDKKIASKIIKNVCTTKEAEMIKWFIKGVSPEYIAIKYDKNRNEIIKQLIVITSRIRNEVEQNEIFELLKIK